MKLQTFDQLACDYNAWEQQPYTGNNTHNHQRFGQYMWNRYDWPGRAAWPQLFYEKNTLVAYSMLLTYVEDQQRAQTNPPDADKEGEVGANS